MEYDVNYSCNVLGLFNVIHSYYSIDIRKYKYNFL